MCGEYARPFTLTAELRAVSGTNIYHFESRFLYTNSVGNGTKITSTFVLTSISKNRTVLFTTWPWQYMWKYTHTLWTISKKNRISSSLKYSQISEILLYFMISRLWPFVSLVTAACRGRRVWSATVMREQGNLTARSKLCSIATSSTTNQTLTKGERKRGVRGEMLGTTRSSHGPAF